MRWLYSLVTLGLLLAMGLSFSLFRYMPHDLDSGTAAVEIAHLKTEFKSKNPALFEINLEELRKNIRSEELQDPNAILPQLTRFRHEEISALIRYAESCDPKIKLSSRSVDLKKATLWHQHVCVGRVLPKRFFDTAPFMHPSGSSYARLAQLHREPFPIHGRHLLEVLNDEPFSASNFRIEASALAEMKKGEDSILTHHHILFLNRTGTEEFAGKYIAYPLKTWDDFIHGKKVIPASPLHFRNCLVREGSLCWVSNPAGDNGRVRKLGRALEIILVALIVILLGLARKRGIQKRQEEEQRLFALQMLTHELRTPITAMSLALETQRAEFDSLPPASQKAFLQMCDEFQRFHRIVEASKNYLKSHDGKKPELEIIPSVNELVQNALDPYQDQISIKLLEVDQSFALNRYWIELCLKNLVENALTHGKRPVKVGVLFQDQELKIAVEDAGKFDLENKQSKGMGLGLAIVKKVIKDMGGDLVFETNPTRFTIQLRKYT